MTRLSRQGDLRTILQGGARAGTRACRSTPPASEAFAEAQPRARPNPGRDTNTENHFLSGLSSALNETAVQIVTCSRPAGRGVMTRETTRDACRVFSSCAQNKGANWPCRILGQVRWRFIA